MDANLLYFVYSKQYNHYNEYKYSNIEGFYKLCIALHVLIIKISIYDANLTILEIIITDIVSYILPTGIIKQFVYFIFILQAKLSI